MQCSIVPGVAPGAAVATRGHHPAALPSRRGRAQRTIPLLLAAAALAAPPAANPATAQVPVAAAAQGADTAAPRPRSAEIRRGNAYVTLGGTGLPLAGLDARLRAGGLPGVSSGATTVGSGAYALVGRVLVGASGHAVLARGTERGGWETRVRGGYALADVGVAAVATRRTLVAGVVGAGAGRVTAKVRPTAGGGFDSTLAAPGRALELSSYTPLAHAGLVADHLVRWRGDRRFVLGVRVGYVGRLGDSRWRADDAGVGGGPRVAPHGAYARLTVGAPLGRARDAVMPAVGSLLPWVTR
jgi:hypothetical protein